MFTLPMHFIDYDTVKGKYCYCHFKVFFHSVIILDHLHLAINNIRNSSNIPRMFPCGHNYAIILKSSYQLNDQVAPLQKSSAWFVTIAYKKFANQISNASLILRYQFKHCWHLGREL